jgi:hypothetical protein
VHPTFGIDQMAATDAGTVRSIEGAWRCLAPQLAEFTTILLLPPSMSIA